MGYSTVSISIESAMAKLMSKGFDVWGASDFETMLGWEDNQIIGACESDHGHIILKLTKGRWVDCVLY